MLSDSNYFSTFEFDSCTRLNPNHLLNNFLKSHPSYQRYNTKPYGALVLTEKFTKGSIKSTKLNLA
jgi:hypothetical protein